MSPSRPNTDPDSLITLELLRAVRQRARDAKWRIEHAFERVGCACAPKRRELDRLEKRLQAQIETIQSSSLGQKIAKLKGEIVEIDLREHRVLHGLGHQAGLFYATWMLERLARGDTTFLDSTESSAEFEFARDWFDGWRPTMRKAGAKPAGEATASTDRDEFVEG